MPEPDALGQLIAGRLRDVPDFPKPGILFKDVSPLFADADALDAVAARLGEGAQVDLVAGVEARGFVLAGAVAAKLHCGVLLVRKAGKLPPPTLRRSYDLEYGTAEIEVPVGIADRKRVLLVDDVLATGGTLRAAADLLVEAGATVTGLGVVLELGFLAGRAALAGLPEVTALLTV